MTAAAAEAAPSPSFFDFPVDVQERILSFLNPPDLSSFGLTSRGAASLLSHRDLHVSLCSRRWGSLTQIPLWPPLPTPLLYHSLFRLHRLLGFWRRVSPSTSPSLPPLIFFHWAPSSLSASTISPSPDVYGGISTSPFLWSGVTWGGKPVSFLRVGEGGEEAVIGEVTFMGDGHIFVEERRDRHIGEEEEEAVKRLLGGGWRLAGGGTTEEDDEEDDMLPSWSSMEIHLVKVPNPRPTPLRPLQGLWKGVCENMKLEFFLVSYDNIGGVACRRVGDTLERFSSFSPVFWTSSTIFMEPPFSRQEEDMYNSREHILLPSAAAPNCFREEEETVSRILCINSSYDLVIPDAYNSSHDPCNAEGRIWVYKSGNFGFGFLRNNFIVDMKPIATNGNMLMLLE